MRRTGLTINMAKVIMTVAVALLVALTAIIFERFPPVAEEIQIDYQTILYDRIYNVSALGYDTHAWGGRVLSSNGYRATSLVVNHLILPVFFFKKVNPTDPRYIEETVRTYFPEVELKTMSARTVLRDGSPDYVIVANESIRLDLRTSGSLGYSVREDYQKQGPVIYWNLQSAEQVALGFIDEHGGMPSDGGSYRSWLVPMDGSIRIVLELGRTYGNLARTYGEVVTDFESHTSSIRVSIDARTGRVMEMERNWPELETTFSVTDLPSPASVVRFHGLDATPYLDANISTVSSSRLWFAIPDAAANAVDQGITDVFFILPHWRVEDNPKGSQEHLRVYYCDAIFPDMVVSDYT